MKLIPSSWLTRWRRLSTREQQSVTVLAIALLIAIIYFGVVEPVNNTISDLQQRISLQQAVLAHIQPEISAATSLKSTTKVQLVAAADLLPTVDQSLQQTGLHKAVTEIRETGNNQVQITFTSVPFDSLVSWLVQLWQAHQIQTARIDVQRADTPGDVQGTLVLQAT
ncbi:MAG: type II secretion system protein M [Gammaproteobacteria bacterium]|nr:type II secretion system protein M [Gammaproteobacteria bacterium]